MESAKREEWREAVGAVLGRFVRQNEIGSAVPAEEIARVAERFAVIATRRDGRADAVGAGDEPREMTAEEVGALVGEVLAGVAAASALAAPVKQLVKGCFQATRRECRESYREVDGAGVCRRQVLAKARERVSGTHCVDCPYWIKLDAAQHAELLAGAWVGVDGAREGTASELAANREVFLPEDFRTLRRLAFTGRS